MPKTCAAYGFKNTDTNLRMKELIVLLVGSSARRYLKMSWEKIKFLKFCVLQDGLKSQDSLKTQDGLKTRGL